MLYEQVLFSMGSFDVYNIIDLIKIASFKMFLWTGLRLTLNIERKEYLEDYVDAFGMRLVIHEPGTFPFPEEEGFTLNPSYETTIGMKLVSIKLC